MASPVSRPRAAALAACLAAALAGCDGSGGSADDGGGTLVPVDDDGVVDTGESAPGEELPGDVAQLFPVLITSDSVALRWVPPAADDSDGFRISRDGEPIGISRTGRFLDEPVPPGDYRYAIQGRRLDAQTGIVITTETVTLDVSVPEPGQLATRVGGTTLTFDKALEDGARVELDALGRLVASGYSGDLFLIERLDDSGASVVRRFIPGLETAELLPAEDVWYVLGDDALERPVIALDPQTLETRWQFDTAALELTGGCRFGQLLADGALSCRGFADDTLRIGSDGAISPTSPGVRIPTGDRLSADDGLWLVDRWTLPAETRPNAFFPSSEWVVREILTGESFDRGALLTGDPRIDFPFTVDAVGVLGGDLVVAGDVLANGCLRVCVEQLAIPPYVDGHFVARVDRGTGAIEALQRLPFGQRLGVGRGVPEEGLLRFVDTDRVTLLDTDTLERVSVERLGGEPVGVARSAILARLDDAEPGVVPGYALFVR